MFAQQVAQRSMRRALQPGALARLGLSKSALAPAAIAGGNNFSNAQIRSTGSTAIKADDAYKILEKQRLNRPVSPHLGIYKWQTSWILSSLHRITGSVLSGALYLFFPAYLISPLMGWHLESASLAAAFAAWPLVAKVALKTTVALPFTFHCINGVRHLIWDTGRELTNKAVIRTGFTVAGLAVASSLYLALFV